MQVQCIIIMSSIALKHLHARSYKERVSEASSLLVMIITIVLDPCLSNPCDNNADCQQIEVSSDFNCTCTSPYTGNGTTCIGK